MENGAWGRGNRHCTWVTVAACLDSPSPQGGKSTGAHHNWSKKESCPDPCWINSFPNLIIFFMSGRVLPRNLIRMLQWGFADVTVNGRWCFPLCVTCTTLGRVFLVMEDTDLSAKDSVVFVSVLLFFSKRRVRAIGRKFQDINGFAESIHYSS